MKKIAIFLCDCGNNLAEKIDFDLLESTLTTYDYVEKIFRFSLLCKKNKQELEHLKGKFTHLLIGACSERSSLTFTEDRIYQLLDYLEVDRGHFESINLREQCLWHHPKASREELTSKALDMFNIAYTKLLFNEKALDLPKFAEKVLVVGGGVAGLSASLNLAKMGIKTTLVEREKYLGGVASKVPFLWQSEGSYGFCTSECVLPVLARDVLFEEKVTPLLSTEIASIEKKQGNFKVTFLQKNNFVNPSLCISCGKCQEVCPVTTPNPFDFGLTQKKAIAKENFLLLPDTYSLDPENCTFCGECAQICPTKAIDLKAENQLSTDTFGALILATGFEAKLPPDISFEPNHPKIITFTQFERLAANRFFGRPPLSVVFVLCQKEHTGHCSRLCCTIAAKHAFRMASFFMGTETRVIYQDFKPIGRSGEFFYKQAQEKGVEFIKTRIKTIEGEDWLTLTTEEGEEIEADLVVMAEPLLPPEISFLKDLKLLTDEQNFPEEFQPKIIRPGESLVERVFLAGSARGIKDVQESIESGANAALKASFALQGKKQKYVSQIDLDKCSHCGLCVPICPHGAILSSKDTPFFIDPGFCKGCGLCVSSCPSRAINLKNLTDLQILEMAKKAFEHALPSEPKILAFLCYWCSYAAGDLVGPKKLELPLNTRTIRVRCSASLNPDLALEILTSGYADGVLIAGCPPKNCHHLWGNYLEDRRVKLLKGTLSTLGLPKESLRFEYIGVTLSDKLAKVLKSMSKNINLS